MPDKISIPHVAWRNGRPRFAPSPSLRKAGHNGHDLKHADGSWRTLDEARAWSASFQAMLDTTRQMRKAKKARDTKQKQAAVIAAIPAAAVPKSYTLGQLLEGFTTTGAAELGHARNTVSAYKSAMRNIERECPDYWFSEAGALRRTEIRAIHAIVAEARSDSAAHMAVVVMSSAYNWAIDNDDEGTLIPGGNPVERIKTKAPGARARVISIAEFLHLVATAEAMGEHAVADMLVWGLWTAQRATDRLTMQWSNLVDGRLEITQQKTGSFVSIPLSAALAERLPKARPNRPRIIDVETEDPRYRRNLYWQRLQVVKAKAAQTMPSVADILDRDLRRTAVTLMGRGRCTIPEVYSITGHRFTGQTRIMGNYMAIDYSIAENAMAKFEERYAMELSKLQERERKAG